MALRTLSIEPGDRLSITLTGHMACRCPINGKRDEATVMVTYTPVDMVLELAAFADYLVSFQARPITHEEATAVIANEVRWSVMSDEVTVTTNWAPVEGVECIVRVVA
jgi:NADPH-dependent 7-cyano-7-deazaguanine reductase QueF